jgi:hypothetical protein
MAMLMHYAHWELPKGKVLVPASQRRSRNGDLTHTPEREHGLRCSPAPNKVAKQLYGTQT